MRTVFSGMEAFPSIRTSSNLEEGELFEALRRRAGKLQSDQAPLSLTHSVRSHRRSCRAAAPSSSVAELLPPAPPVRFPDAESSTPLMTQPHSGRTAKTLLASSLKFSSRKIKRGTCYRLFCKSLSCSQRSIPVVGQAYEKYDATRV